MRLRDSVEFFLALLVVVSGVVFLPVEGEVSGEHEMKDSVYRIATEESFLNGTLNGLMVYSGEDGVRLTLKDNGNWTYLGTEDQPPRGTRDQMAELWGTSDILYYSEYNFGVTGLFHLRTNRWELLNLEDTPGSREGSCMASIHSEKKVLLFGGRKYMSGFQSDTWIFDLETKNWTYIDPTASPPGRMYAALSPVYGVPKVVMFGGVPIEYGSQTWLFDYTRNTWVNRTVSYCPTGRSKAAMAPIYGTPYVLLHGGVNKTGKVLSDTWIYDVNTGKWTFLVENGPYRCFHRIVPIYREDMVLLFGGKDQYYRETNDVYIFDFSQKKWYKLNPPVKPPAVSKFGMAPGWMTKKFVLYGDWDSRTWVYTFGHYVEDGVYITPPINLTAPSTIVGVRWSGNAPTNAQVKYRVRTGETMEEMNAKKFVGPEGNESDFYVQSGAAIWEKHNGDRWMQVEFFFHTENVTVSPAVTSIEVVYNNLPHVKIARRFDVTLAGDVTIPFQVFDNEGNRITIKVEYSTDNRTFFEATLKEYAGEYGYSSDPQGAYNHIVWDSKKDLGYVDTIVYVKITPKDRATGYSDTTMPFRVDNLPPKVVSVYPFNRSKDVSVYTKIKVVFNERVEVLNTPFSPIVLYDVTGEEVITYLNVDAFNYTIILTPTQPLNFESVYTVQINPSFKDARGNMIAYCPTYVFYTMEDIDFDQDGFKCSVDEDDDDDGYTDIEELVAGTNPLSPSSHPTTPPRDSDEDGLPDVEDPDDDNDGYLDVWEITLGNDPFNGNDKPLDTDGDGMPDGDAGNSEQWMDPDDDNDGYSDFDELRGGTDPKLASSHPIEMERASPVGGLLVATVSALLAIVIVVLAIIVRRRRL